jgi:hypothetical protein
MIPKEIKRDAAGLTRLGRIKHADHLIDKCRFMAEAAEADPDNGFADFADPDRGCGCGDPRACGAASYRSDLERAASDYRRAGLGRLSGLVDVLRVQTLAPRAIQQAWDEFDSANAITEV